MATCWRGACLRLPPASCAGNTCCAQGLDPSTDQPHIINNHSKNSHHLNSTLHPQDAVKPQMLNHKQLSLCLQ